MRDVIILSNQATCKECGDSIYSAHRHDYVTCSCGSISVDGGMSYLKRAGKLDRIIEQSIVMDKELSDKVIAGIEEAIDSGRNPLGVLCNVARCLRDNGYEVVNSEAVKYVNKEGSI